MRLREFLLSPTRFRVPSDGWQVNPFHDEGALNEAAVHSVQLDTVTNTLWILIDLRGSLQIKDGNTAVFVARDLRSYNYSPGAAGRWNWQTISSWEPRSSSQNRLFELEIGLGFTEWSTLSLSSASADSLASADLEPLNPVNIIRYLK